LKAKSVVTIFGLLITCPFISTGQTPSNLDEINRLVEKSVVEISRQWQTENRSISLNITIPDSYMILKGKITSAFSGENFIISSAGDINKSVDYTLEEAKVNYNQMFRGGFLGSFQVERETKLTGSFIFKESGFINKTNDFSLSVKDTVFADEINKLENPALPFTHSDLPEEPFLSGLLEPVIAIGSSVVAIILFFTVRSK
jgi:hypothetical protein